MRVVVTGGIGTGKSTVSRALQQRMPGHTLVSADDMVRDLYAKSAEFRAELIARFGTADRKTISGLVFADDARRADLVALSWVYLAKEVDALFSQPNIIFEFPLFFEHPHWVGRPDAVVVLGCDAKTQRERVLARDGITEEALARILAAQLPLEDKARRADIYLDTSGTLAAVLDAVAKLPVQLLALKLKKEGVLQ